MPNICQIARHLVLFMRRGSGQRQFSSQVAAQVADHPPIRELIAWISENLDADLRVPALARRVAMSERNFSRAFTQQVSVTPGRFVARLRTGIRQSQTCRHRPQTGDRGGERRIRRRRNPAPALCALMRKC